MIKKKMNIYCALILWILLKMQFEFYYFPLMYLFIVYFVLQFLFLPVFLYLNLYLFTNF